MEAPDVSAGSLARDKVSYDDDTQAKFSRPGARSFWPQAIEVPLWKVNMATDTEKKADEAKKTAIAYAMEWGSKLSHRAHSLLSQDTMIDNVQNHRCLLRCSQRSRLPFTSVRFSHYP